MSESKIGLTDRLRASGQWDEASVWKDAKVKELRVQGMKGAAAKEEAWRLLAEKYPPGPKTTAEDLDKWLQSAIEHDVRKWRDRNRVTLGIDAMEDLVNQIDTFCRLMAMRQWPGPRYQQEDEWLHDPLEELRLSALAVGVSE